MTAGLMVLLYLFFRFTRVGIAMQAASQNKTAATLVGISVPGVNSLVWALGAGMAGVAGILIAPITFVSGCGLCRTPGVSGRGPRRNSAPTGAFVGGIVIGLLEVFSGFYLSEWVRNAAPYMALLAVLFIRPSSLSKSGCRRRSRPMVAQHSASGSRRSGRMLLLAVVALLATAGLPFLLNCFFVGVVTSVLIWTIIGLGMVVLLGYSGQVSIGHSAFLAIGAYGHALLIGAGVPFFLSVPIVVVTCLVVGALIALPGLRFSGVYLAMATLAFAFIVEAVIGDLEITGGRGGMPVPREKLSATR